LDQRPASTRACMCCYRVAKRFVQAYPQVALETVAEDRKVDPGEDNYDILILEARTSRRLKGARRLQLLKLPRCAKELGNDPGMLYKVSPRIASGLYGHDAVTQL
jgi:hypothetical protein